MHDQTHGKAQSKQVVKDLASSCHSLFTSTKGQHCNVTHNRNNFCPLTYLSGQQFICYLSRDAGIKQWKCASRKKKIEQYSNVN